VYGTTGIYMGLSLHVQSVTLRVGAMV